MSWTDKNNPRNHHDLLKRRLQKLHPEEPPQRIAARLETIQKIESEQEQKERSR